MLSADNTEQVRDPAILAKGADENLVQMLVFGNHDAMGVIVDRYYAMIMRVALRIVRDAAKAEDVVQITFTDFYRNAKNVDRLRAVYAPGCCNMHMREAKIGANDFILKTASIPSLVSRLRGHIRRQE
jgi:hypothetical protein